MTGLKWISGLLVAFMLAAEGGELFRVPRGWPQPEYSFKKNPITPEKVELGRLLFYDPILSANQTVSCASCHSPYNAFSHTDHALSHGIFDSIGTRNAPALFNLAWHRSFMWDGAVNHLDVQALAPIHNRLEMGEDIANVVQKLRAVPLYRDRFLSAWGDSAITGERLLKSLALFQVTLVSADSRYDKVKRGESNFSEQEKKGEEIFARHCSACHQPPLFTQSFFTSNGLPVDPDLNDQGRGAITQDRKDSLGFKIPSLRNLSFTFPYMHDGRFTRLTEVIQHYSEGIVDNGHLGKNLRAPLHLKPEEKVDLLAFLLTLNDTAFVFDKRHGFPEELKGK